MGKIQIWNKPTLILTTEHKDVAERLWQVDKTLAKQVEKVLQYNKADRHLRGGIATKRKYEIMKNNKN